MFRYIFRILLLLFLLVPLWSVVSHAQEAEVISPERAEMMSQGAVPFEQLLRAIPEDSPVIESGKPKPLRFNYVGPGGNIGRVSAIVGIRGDTTTYYVGGASGGIWKTTNGTRTFKPIFDDQPVQAIGALAVAPSDTSIVWAGTGEPWVIRDQSVLGNGVYKSLDGGKTWQHMGLTQTGRIAEIEIDPANPKIVYVCALGRTTGKQQQRGVFRTKDGGKTWERVLFVNPGTGCSDLAMDPNNPNVLLAGMWDVKVRPWGMISGGSGSGLYITHDGGDSWTHIKGPGLPNPPLGKIGVAIAPSDPDRMYALIQTAGQGSLWRSDDGGESWNVVSWDRRLIGRAGYYMNIAVNPADKNEVLVANSTLWRSVDGGHTFKPAPSGGCGDCHDIWMDPLNADHWAVTGDAGASVITNHGENTNHFSLPIGQMYHVAVDHQTPYLIYSNAQDDGVMRGPSDEPAPVWNVPSYYDGKGVSSGVPGGGPAHLPRDRERFVRFGVPQREDPGWVGFPAGCESGMTLPKPGNPNIVWWSCYGNNVTRYNAEADIARTVNPWVRTLDSPPGKLKYRCHWSPPLAIDPLDPNTVYYGCQVIFRTQDGGQSWEVISPDLSRPDTPLMSSGGLVANPSPLILGDNLGQFYGGVIFAIAPSKTREGVIWAGTNDGLIWITKDGGKTWKNVTDNIEGLPEWGTVRQITPSAFQPGKAYVAIDFHLVDNLDPYIYKTSNYGKTWTKISGDLPSNNPLDYAMSIAENPNRPGMLFAGTGHAFYYSMNDGKTWTQFGNGLPAVPVSWIAPQKLYHDVVISTYGRGLFVLRGLVRLEQKKQAEEADGPYLFKPRAGIRHARRGKTVFLYSLKSEPQKPVRFEILNSNGKVIRTLRVDSHEGLNRITWNLLYEGPRQIKFRTTPPFDPFIWNEPRFEGEQTRPFTHWGIGRTKRVGPIAAPGQYTVRMTVNGETYSRPFKIVSDPSIPWPDSGMVASTHTQVRIRDLINVTVGLVNRIEIMREQIENLLAAGQPEAVTASLKELNDKMLDVEMQLVTKTALHSDDKWYVEHAETYLQLIWLYAEVGLGSGDIAGGAAHRPTKAEMAWLGRLKQDINAAKSDFSNLVQNIVPKFNERMAGKLPPINDEVKGITVGD